MLWLALILAAIFVLTLPYHRERRRVDVAQIRADAPGATVDLPQGKTHYQLLGPRDGRLIVMVHGLTTPSQVFYGITDKLIGSGYRVLIYDLYGRGYSDAPTGRQDAKLFLDQLEGLLDALNIRSPFILAGYSMGGAIATAFAASNPNRVERLVGIAPAGILHRLDRFTRFCVKTPMIGDWIYAMFEPDRATRRIRETIGQDFDVPGIAEVQLAEYSGKGFLRSVLSSLRYFLSRQQKQEHRTVMVEDIPILAIWGTRDNVIPFKSMGILRRWNHSSEHRVIPDAGHDLPYTHSEEIAQFIDQFCQKPKTPVSSAPHTVAAAQ